MACPVHLYSRSLKTTEFRGEILGTQISGRRLFRQDHTFSHTRAKLTDRKIHMSFPKGKDSADPRVNYRVSDQNQYGNETSMEHCTNFQNDFVGHFSVVGKQTPLQTSILPSVIQNEPLIGSKITLHNRGHGDLVNSIECLTNKPNPSSYLPGGGCLGVGQVQPIQFIKYSHYLLKDPDDANNFQANDQNRKSENDIERLKYPLECIHTSNGDVVAVTKRLCEGRDLNVYVTSHRPHRTHGQEQHQRLIRTDLPAIDYPPSVRRDNAESEDESLTVSEVTIHTGVDFHQDIKAYRSNTKDRKDMITDDDCQGCLRKLCKTTSKLMDEGLSQRKPKEYDITKKVYYTCDNDVASFETTVESKEGEQRSECKQSRDIFIPSDNHFDNDYVEAFTENDTLASEKLEHSFLSNPNVKDALGVEPVRACSHDNVKTETRQCNEYGSIPPTTSPFEHFIGEGMKSVKGNKSFHFTCSSSSIDLKQEQQTSLKRSPVTSTVIDIPAAISIAPSREDKAVSLLEPGITCHLDSNISLSKMNFISKSNLFSFSSDDHAHIYVTNKSEGLVDMNENSQNLLKTVTHANESKESQRHSDATDESFGVALATSNTIGGDVTIGSEDYENICDEISIQHFSTNGYNLINQEETQQEQKQTKTGNPPSQATSMMSSSNMSFLEREIHSDSKDDVTAENTLAQKDDNTCAHTPRHKQETPSSSSHPSGINKKTHPETVHKYTDSFHKCIENNYSCCQPIDNTVVTLESLIKDINMSLCGDKTKDQNLGTADRKDMLDSNNGSNKTYNAQSSSIVRFVPEQSPRTFDKDSEPFKTRAELLQMEEKDMVSQYNESVEARQILASSSLSLEDKIIWNSSLSRIIPSTSEDKENGESRLIKAGCYIWLPQTDQLPQDIQEGCCMFEAVKLPGLANDKTRLDLMQKNISVSQRSGPQVPSRYMQLPQHKLSLMEENKAKIRARRNESWQYSLQDQSKTIDDILATNGTNTWDSGNAFTSLSQSERPCQPFPNGPPKSQPRYINDLIFEQGCPQAQKGDTGISQLLQGKTDDWDGLPDRVSRPQTKSASTIRHNPTSNYCTEVGATIKPIEENIGATCSLSKPPGSRERSFNKLTRRTQIGDRPFVESLLDNFNAERVRQEAKNNTQAISSIRNFNDSIDTASNISARNRAMPCSFSSFRAGKQLTFPRKQSENNIYTDLINRPLLGENYDPSLSKTNTRNHQHTKNLINRNRGFGSPADFPIRNNSCQMPSLFKPPTDRNSRFASNTSRHEVVGIYGKSLSKEDYSAHNSSFQDASRSLHIESRSSDAILDSANPEMDSMTTFSVISLPNTFLLPTPSHLSTADDVDTGVLDTTGKDSIDTLNRCNSYSPAKSTSSYSVKSQTAKSISPCLGSETLPHENIEGTPKTLETSFPLEPNKTADGKLPGCGTDHPAAGNNDKIITNCSSHSLDLDKQKQLTISKKQVIGDYFHQQNTNNAHRSHNSKSLVGNSSTSQSIICQRSSLLKGMGDNKEASTTVSKLDENPSSVCRKQHVSRESIDDEIFRMKTIPELSTFDVLVTGKGLEKTFQVTKTQMLTTNRLKFCHRTNHSFQDQSQIWKMFGNQSGQQAAAFSSNFVNAQTDRQTPKTVTSLSVSSKVVDFSTRYLDGDLALNSRKFLTRPVRSPDIHGHLVSAEEHLV